MSEFDEVFRSLPKDGWLTQAEAKLLWDLALMTDGDILELGTYCGRSAKVLATAISRQPNRRLFCCDPVIEGFDQVVTLLS